MTTQYNIDKYISGVNGFGLLFCDTIFSATLVAAADTTLVVPGIAAIGAPTATSFNKFIAIFSYSPAGSVYVALNATAAVPAGGAFAGTTSELNPLAKTVKTGDTIHFKSAGTPSVTVAFYAIQE